MCLHVYLFNWNLAWRNHCRLYSSPLLKKVHWGQNTPINIIYCLYHHQTVSNRNMTTENKRIISITYHIVSKNSISKLCSKYLIFISILSYILLKNLVHISRHYVVLDFVIVIIHQNQKRWISIYRLKTFSFTTCREWTPWKNQSKPYLA